MSILAHTHIDSSGSAYIHYDCVKCLKSAFTPSGTKSVCDHVTVVIAQVVFAFAMTRYKRAFKTVQN